jgi:hypothetical protein
MVLLLFWTSSLALTSSHHHLHLTGSPDSDLQCVVCLFAHGQVAAPESSPVRAWRDLGGAVEAPLPGLVRLAQVDVDLPQGRAPPFTFC